jgi:hypothetical protein
VKATGSRNAGSPADGGGKDESAGGRNWALNGEIFLSEPGSERHQGEHQEQAYRHEVIEGHEPHRRFCDEHREHSGHGDDGDSNHHDLQEAAQNPEAEFCPKQQSRDQDDVGDHPDDGLAVMGERSKEQTERGGNLCE